MQLAKYLKEGENAMYERLVKFYIVIFQNLLPLYLIIAFAISGCVGRNSLDNRSIRAGWSPRAQLEGIVYDIDLPDSVETTSVDPNNPNSVRTTTDLDTGGGMALSLGAEGFVGYKWLHILGGIMGSANPFAASKAGYRQSNFDVEREKIGGESYAFTQLTPEWWKVIPYLGLGSQIGPMLFTVEAGIPVTGFELRTGRDTFSEWRRQHRETWEGDGWSIGGSILLQLEKKEAEKGKIGLFFRYEEFEPEFKGEKSEIGVYNFGLDIRF